MEGATQAVEENIKAIFPDILALVFDGRAFGDVHYVAFYAT